MKGMIESARTATVTALEQLVKDGYITSFEEWGSLDEEDGLEEEEIDALYFVAYSESPRSVERLLAELSGRLSREYRIPILIFTFKDTRD
jgi:hypothetical protein